MKRRAVWNYLVCLLFFGIWMCFPSTLHAAEGEAEELEETEKAAIEEVEKIPWISVIPLYEKRVIEVLAYVPGEADRVSAPVWTEKNGQDDVVWHSMASGSWERDGREYNWGTQIPIAEHNGEWGIYRIHIYGYRDTKTVAQGEAEPCLAGTCRIQDKYYPDLCEALWDAKDHDTIYVCRDHTLYSGYEGMDRTFSDVKVVPESGEKRIYTTERYRMVFANSSIAFGSRETGALIFDLEQSALGSGDEEYCGVICANTGSKVIMQNCVMQNGQKMNCWLVHGEFGSISVEACRFQNACMGIGIVTDSDSSHEGTGQTIQVSDTLFTDITGGTALHFNVMHENLQVQFLRNTFRRCMRGIVGVRVDSASYQGKVEVAITENRYENCYIGELFSQGKRFSAEQFQASIHGTTYDGHQYKEQGDQPQDSWFSSGMINSNVTALIGDSSYSNGIHGISNIEGGRTVIIENTRITGNDAGLSSVQTYAQNGKGGGIFLDSGSVSLQQGEIRENSADQGGGVWIQDGTLIHSGGRIVDNTAETGSGIYLDGEYEMSRNAGVETGNDVYIKKNRRIKVTEELSGEICARLTPEVYENGTAVAEVCYGEKKGSTNLENFTLTERESFCLRPGDYQTEEAGTKAEEIVISTGYPVRYEKNTAGAVTSMPDSSVKYWYENFRISEQVPEWEDIAFQGWSEDPQAETGEFSPASEVDASENKEHVFYAVWKDEIYVLYAGNGATAGEQKKEKLHIRTV